MAFSKDNFLVGFVVLCLFLVACENDMAKVNSVTTDVNAKTPVESTKDVEFLYSDSAQIQLKLTAPQTDRFVGDKSYFEMPKGMHVLFYGKYPKVQTELKADYGVGYDTINGIKFMEVKRNVVVINEKGDRLNTEHLIWNANSKRIYTQDFVKITTKDEVIWGDGLEADEDFSKYEIKNVKGQINIKDTLQ